MSSTSLGYLITDCSRTRYSARFTVGGVGLTQERGNNRGTEACHTVPPGIFYHGGMQLQPGLKSWFEKNSFFRFFKNSKPQVQILGF